MSTTRFGIGLAALCILVACSDKKGESVPGIPDGEATPETTSDDDSYVEPEGLPGLGAGACDYVNPFSELNECKQ